MKLIYATTAVLLTLTTTVTAKAETAEEALALANKLHEERLAFPEEQTPESWSKMDESAAAATRAFDLTSDNELKYDAKILLSQIFYNKGSMLEVKAERLAAYDSAVEAARGAQEVNPEYADGYYYYSIALARWAETKGVLESLKRKGELFENLDKALEKFTKAGDLGEEIDGYGPNRTYGRVYFKLPGFAGGSNKKSLEYLETAINEAPEVALNIVYYVETLYAGDSADKIKACAIIDDMLSKTPEEYNSERLVPTKREFRTAEKLREKMKKCD